MERESFLKILATRFYPLLRAEGFRGSGTTLRHVHEPVVLVVNIQGSSTAVEFYVNLGAHLTFLPTEGGGVCVATRLKEYECAFRERIEPPPGANLGPWAYGHSVAEAETVVVQLTQEWQRQGQSFFKRYSDFPEGFTALVQSAVASPPHPRDGLKYARIALELGLRDEAIVLARVSLAGLSDGATGLRVMYRRFLNELGAE